jgi:hypothetical protein
MSYGFKFKSTEGFWVTLVSSNVDEKSKLFDGCGQCSMTVSLTGFGPTRG